MTGGVETVVSGKSDAYERVKTLAYLPRRMPEVLFRVEILRGEPVAIVFDAIRQKVYRFKGSAIRVWQLLDGRRTVGEIVAMISDEAKGVDVGQIRSDVCMFLAKAGRGGLIRAALKSKNNEGD